MNKKRALGSLIALLMLLAGLALTGCSKGDSGGGGHDMQHMNMSGH